MSVAALPARTVRRDRLVVLASAALACALAWALLIRHDGGHAAMTGPMAHAVHGLAPGTAVAWRTALPVAFAMWFLMMVAMMLPAVAPWITLFAALGRRRAPGAPYLPTAAFAGGYFTVWAAYSLVAAAVQVALQRAARLDADLTVGALAGGALLVAAGLFQFSPLKAACLTHCRNPLSYLITRWRDGPAGAFGVGASHGIFCAGCCWVLMALGFGLGVMNLTWMAALTVAIALEKNAPWGAAWSKVYGLVLVGWGAWLMAAAVR